MRDAPRVRGIGGPDAPGAFTQSIGCACTGEVRGKNWDALYQLCEQRLKRPRPPAATRSAANKPNA